MAVIEQEVVENSGLIKEFDEDSIDMLMTIFQKDLYVKPIESSIRETFSNSYDAVKEKNIAISILKGDTKVEDHFEVSNDRATKNSKFNPDYYNLDYLSDNDKVKITYTETKEGRDNLAIEDYGVGLTNGRLKGFFAPGYSSKRLSKSLLGKYGAGNKSPLATNIDFYVLESWYNGKYTKFMVYDNYYKCIVAKEGSTLTTEIKGKKEVDGEVVDAIEYVYWTDTDRKNGVCVSFEVKKHNKTSFIDAVKDQLLYFKDALEFIEVNEETESRIERNNIFADVLLDTPTFLISDNWRFTNPHILINNVNYGIIDFAELGINKRFGNIAIKANASDVDITASRESVKWTEKTKQYVLKAVEHAAYAAGEQLKETLDTFENPIERYVKSNSNKLNLVGDVNDNIIANLKRFSGDVKANIPIDITGFVDVKVRKKLGIPDTIQVAKLMLYIDTMTVVQNINVNQNRITANKAVNLNSIIMDKDTIFLVAENVTSIRTNMAHYLAKGEKSFQYVIFKDLAHKTMTKEEALTARIPYKRVLQQEVLFKVYRKVFTSLLNKYCTDVDSIDAEAVKEYAKELKMEDDAAIVVKEDSNTSYYIKVKSVKEEKNTVLKEMKRTKRVLPYKIQRIPSNFDSNGLMSHQSWLEQVHYAMKDAKADDLAEVTATVYYASSKERDLLNIAGFMAQLNKKKVNNFKEEGVAFILVAEDNKKHFKSIPNVMEIKEFFKQEHKVEDGELVLTGGEIMRDFMTTFRLQQALINNPGYFTLAKSEGSVFDSFISSLKANDASLEELEMIENVRSRMRKVPLTDTCNSIEELKDTLNQNFSTTLSLNEDSVKSMFGMLDNMCNLQDVGEIQDIEDEELKAQVSNFKSYDITYFDKKFVDSAVTLLSKYKYVFILSSALSAVKGEYSINAELQEEVREELESRIKEFFNNLNK